MAAAPLAERQLLDLSLDELAHILFRLPLAHDIAAVAPTCHALCAAAKLARKARPFSGYVVTLAGHDAFVTCVAAAPDGRIITGSRDQTVKVWRDGACERTIHAHSAVVRAVAALPDGRRFLSGSNDGTAKLWSFDGERERTFEEPYVVGSLAAVPDGKRFALGTWESVKLFRVDDGTLLKKFDTPFDGLSTVAVTRDAQFLVGAMYAYEGVKHTYVWSLTSYDESFWASDDWSNSQVDVDCVALMPDGQRILYRGGWGSDVPDVTEGSVVVARVHGGMIERVIQICGSEAEVAENQVAAIVAMPDNQHALSAGDDRTLKLFNVNDGAVLRCFAGQSAERSAAMALLPDGLRLVKCVGSTACIVYHGLAPVEDAAAYAVDLSRIEAPLPTTAAESEAEDGSASLSTTVPEGFAVSMACAVL